LEIIKSRVAEQTFDSYEMMLRVHIRPKIGELKLSDIKILTVQKVYSEMQATGLSPRTVRYAHSIFSMALKKAVELGYIVNNPCSYAELPRQNKKETKAFSPEQAQKFLEAAKDDRHGLIFEIALSSGMRPEEYLSLCWKDIDFCKRHGNRSTCACLAQGRRLYVLRTENSKIATNSSFTKINFTETQRT
jgi:integrase